MPPIEYVEAKMVHEMCQAYQSLPGAGGVLDQDVGFLRMHAVLVAGGYFGTPDAPPSAPPRDALAGIEMVTL